jgi:hypothetical protein
MSEWHYSKNNQQLGPVTSTQLRQLAGSGQIHPTDMVWKDGMPDWVPAGKIKGLFATNATARPSAAAATATATLPQPTSPQPDAYDVQPAQDTFPAVQQPATASIAYYNPSEGLGARVARTLRGFPPPTGMQGEWPLSEMHLAQLKEAEKQRKAIRSCAGLFAFLGFLYALVAIFSGIGGFFAVSFGPSSRGTTWASGFIMGFAGVMTALAILAFFAKAATLRCRIWAPITFIALFSIGLIFNLVSLAITPASGPARNTGVENTVGVIVMLMIGGAFIFVCAKALVAIPKFLAAPVWAQEALVNAKL